MIKLVRVDHRLIHGQVAFAWTKSIATDCILIASDALLNDPLKMSVMKLAKPADVKLVMKNIADSITALNSDITDKYHLMVLCESIADVYQLAINVPMIKTINLGGTKSGADRRQIAKAVHVSDQDQRLLNDLSVRGINVYAQLVPDDAEININKLL